jgi:hypothetical protein
METYCAKKYWNIYNTCPATLSRIETRLKVEGSNTISKSTIPAVINEKTAEAEITKIVEMTDKIAENSKTTISNSAVPPAASSSIKAKSTRGRKKMEKIKFPVKPRVIQVVKKPRIYMHHSYRDFSSVPPETNFEVSEQISEMTIPQKVHHILSQEKFHQWVTWLPHGRAFRVSSAVNFEKMISHEYFGHKRFSSFLRHLSNNDFRHISSGPDRNAYYHEASKLWRTFDGVMKRLTNLLFFVAFVSIVYAPRTSASYQIHAGTKKLPAFDPGP